MALEQWDASRRKWILYSSQESQSEDCVKYPLETLPTRIFLDTNVVNLLVKHAETVFEMQPIDPSIPESRANEIEALLHIFQTGQRALWELVVSEKTIEEILLTRDEVVRGDLLDYVVELVETGSEDSEHAHRLGRRLANASIISALPDRSDRELIGNAIGFGCDAFCTSDQRTIISKRHLLPNLGLQILTPVEWWAHIKPWAGLWL